MTNRRSANAVLFLLPWALSACGPAGNVPTDTAGDVDVTPEASDGDTADGVDTDGADADGDEGEADAARRATGEPCERNSECEGAFCVTTDLDPSFVGGYCSAIYCNPHVEGLCGPGAACFDTEINPPLCAKTCESDADCRTPDYACVGTCIPAYFTSTLDRPGTLDGTEADVAGFVAAVSAERIMRRVRILAGEEDWDGPGGAVRIRSRAVGHPDHDVAVDYVDAELTAMGLTVVRLPFEAGSVPHVNILADVPGSDPGLDPVLVTAHYDSIASGTTGWDPAADPAPGAVDNASGTAFALEVAEILTTAGTPRPRRTVRIVLFDGEEHGLYGSEDYVADVVAGREPIACTLNVDMVGWSTTPTAGRFWYLFSEASRSFAAFGVEAIDLFAPEARLIVSSYTGAGNSDHASFWDADLCAVGLASFPRRASNHTVLDTSAEFQPEFFGKVTRSAAAVVAAWAYR